MTLIGHHCHKLHVYITKIRTIRSSGIRMEQRFITDGYPGRVTREASAMIPVTDIYVCNEPMNTNRGCRSRYLVRHSQWHDKNKTSMKTRVRPLASVKNQSFKAQKGWTFEVGRQRGQSSSDEQTAIPPWQCAVSPLCPHGIKEVKPMALPFTRSATRQSWKTKIGL